VETVTALPTLPPRPADSNKGTFGRVLVVAGSRGMSGAAILSASAALRAGAGLVYLAVPQGIQPIVAAGNPCYLTVGLPDDLNGLLTGEAEAVLHSTAVGMSVVALGPGLGRSPGVSRVVTALLASCRLPFVLDADGLNALEGQAARLKGNPGPRVLTPHPGEFARLTGTDIASVQANRQEQAARFAAEQGVVVLLKGHGTIVTDGRRMYQNATGNPGMATGGTGDVLTGVIAALLAQGLEAFAAAQLGAWWHGLAGDLARDELGEVCLIASDLLQFLPQAWRAAG
jgi:NAD(P)H-hydrate epimerase